MSTNTTPGLRAEPLDRRHHRGRPWRLWMTLWMLGLLNLASTALLSLRERTAVARADERGNVTTDNLAWIVFGVIAIVAIGALIDKLGGRVVNWVQGQLGIG
jgi:hypothetical protein